MDDGSRSGEGAPQQRLSDLRLPLRRLPRLLRDPLGVLDDATRGRDVVRLRLGPRSVYVVSEPRLIQLVLEDEARAFARFGPEATTERRLAGASVALLDGEAHARRRHAIEAVFEEEAMTGHADAAVEAAAALGRAWREGAAVDLEREMTDLHLATIGRIAFGRDHEHVDAAVRSLYAVSRVVLRRGFNPAAPLLWRLPLPLTRRFDQARGVYDTAVQRVIEERRRAGGSHADLLGQLLAAREPDGRELTDGEIRDELWAYLAQGAPAYALVWAWWTLARTPQADEELRDELANVLQGRDPSAADLPRLELARAVFLESLRLYPTSLGAVRRAARDVELGPVRIPAGAIVLVSYWSMHRDERYWPHAHRFDSDRRLGDGPFLSFSAGRRSCPARSLAILTGTLQLATLAQRWRPVPLPQDVRLRVIPFVSPRGGLRARLARAAGN